MKLLKRYSNPNGFSLVEILASITLLGIVLVTFMPVFAQFTNVVKISENNLTAINYAEKIEALLKEKSNAVTFQAGVSCQTPDKYTMEDLSEEVRNEIDKGVNDTKYYPEIYICQSSQDSNLYEARIDIYTQTNNNQRRYFTHIYTYLASDPNEES